MTLHRAFFLAGAFALFPAVAQAQMPCAQLETIVEALNKEHHETIAWEGVMPTASGPFEFLLFQSEMQQTWTLVRVHGIMACIVAAGRDGSSVVTGRGA